MVCDSLRVCSRCRVQKSGDEFCGFDHYCSVCRRAQVAVAEGKRREAKAAVERLRLARPEVRAGVRERARVRYRETFRSVKSPLTCPICNTIFWAAKNQKVCSGCREDWSARNKYVRWGLTPELYGRWKRAAVCHICGEPSAGRMAIDHSETTGRLGYAHQRCNLGIAQARHDPEVLRAWIAYLS